MCVCMRSALLCYIDIEYREHTKRLYIYYSVIVCLAYRYSRIHIIRSAQIYVAKNTKKKTLPQPQNIWGEQMSFTL